MHTVVKSSRLFQKPQWGVHKRASVKEHLVRHGGKHEVQVHTTKKKQTATKTKTRTHFQKNNKPEKDH